MNQPRFIDTASCICEVFMDNVSNVNIYRISNTCTRPVNCSYWNETFMTLWWTMLF